jgi:hypothetical protein
MKRQSVGICDREGREANIRRLKSLQRLESELSRSKMRKGSVLGPPDELQPAGAASNVLVSMRRFDKGEE